MISLPGSLLLAYAMTAGIVWAGVQWWRKWRRMPPGPYGVPLLGYLPFMAWSKSPIHLNLFKDLHDKYGPIISVSAAFQDLILVSDTDIIKELYKKDEVLGRPNTEILDDAGGHVHGEGKVWRENRKFALHFFRDYLFKDTEKLNEFIMQSVRDAVVVFDENLDRPYDLGITLKICIVKVLYTVVVKKTNFPMLYPFVVRKCFEALVKMEQLAFRMMLPKFVTNRLPFCIKTQSALAEMADWLDQLALEDIRSHQQEGILDRYVGQYMEQINLCEDECFTEKELLRNVRSLFLAGTETTSTALKWAIKHLVDYPEVQQRCQEEIDGIVGNQRLPHLQDIPHLPYLKAFIEENFRLAALLPLILRQSTEDCYCKGYFIPKGAWCIASATACHRNNRLFTEPDVMKPERFLDENSAFVKPRQGMITFGTGKRRCFGEKIARIQLALFLSTFIQKFHFMKASNPTSKDEQEVVIGVNYPPSFQVIIQKRNTSSP